MNDCVRGKYKTIILPSCNRASFIGEINQHKLPFNCKEKVNKECLQNYDFFIESKPNRITNTFLLTEVLKPIGK